MTPFEGDLDDTAPRPLGQAEVVRERVLNASAEDVTDALDMDIVRLVEATKNNAGSATARSLRNRLLEARSAEKAIIKWAQRNGQLSGQGEPTLGFPAYINGLVEAGDDTDDTLFAANWVDGRYYKAVGDVIRDKEQQERAQADIPAQTDTRPAIRLDPKAEAVQQEQAVRQARDSVERAHGAELFNEIIQLGKKRTQIDTDILNGFRQIGDGPRNESSIAYTPRRIEEETQRDDDWRQHLHEAATFTAIFERDTRIVERKNVESGRFGRKHVTSYSETEEVPGSEHAKVIRNGLTGENEPVVRFRYHFGYSVEAITAGELPKYKEFQGGRSGQHLYVGVDLPKSAADELLAQVQQDPASVRQLAESLALENNDGTLNEEYWRNGGRVGNPVRPPYEALPRGWNIAVVTGEEVVKEGPVEILDYDVQRLAVSR